MPSQDRNWHVEKKIPLALMGMLLLQTFAVGWWASATSERVTTLERRMDAAAPQADRLTRVEVKIETVQSGIEEIKQLIRGKTN